MKKFEQSLEKFLKLVEENTGASPQFSLNYSKSRIIIVKASSGFLKRLYNDPRVHASLCEEGISVEYFAD
jgi:hypothetical protein